MKWNIEEAIARQTQVLSAIDEANRILRQGNLLYQNSALYQAQRHLDELRRISDLTQAQSLLIENARYELGVSTSIMGKLPNSILDCAQGKLGALDIATHFRMPHLEEASRKFDELRAAGNFRISTEFLATHREYESLASRLVTPWIDEKSLHSHTRA